MKHVKSMPEELIECKVCHEKKSKKEQFKKARQVTCNDCLEKAKNRRAASALDRIAALEKQNDELRKRLEKEMEEKKFYLNEFESFAGKYEKLCINISKITLVE